MEQLSQKDKDNNINKINIENDKEQDNNNKADFKKEKPAIGTKVSKINFIQKINIIQNIRLEFESQIIKKFKEIK